MGKLDRADYVIEKLVYESQPGYHCTANIYVPKRRELPLPGVLFTCGHAAEGKAARLYHECCLALTLKGYVVLALDPTGQGERSEYFDSDSGEPLVPLCVSHHHYLGRPSWLVGRSLAGYRTWGCARAIDYLISRPEVDPDQIAAVGNSGGGIMALLITAYDSRVKVCAAAHPGGSMEQTFLTGRQIPQADILSLIPPRPCLFVVGRDSGEEAGHRNKMNGMLPFYKGLGVDTDRCRMVLVDGVHNMEQPKREPCYAWLNKWFGAKTRGQRSRLLPRRPRKHSAAQRRVSRCETWVANPVERSTLKRLSGFALGVASRTISHRWRPNGLAYGRPSHGESAYSFRKTASRPAQPRAGASKATSFEA